MKIHLSLSVAIFCSCGLQALAADPLTPPAYPKNCDTPDLPAGYDWPPITSKMPYDRKSLQTAGAATESTDDCGVFETQKQFDLFSWSLFIALNWPADSDGDPLSDPIGTNLAAPRVWETYLAPGQVFKPGGAEPDPWGTPEGSERSLSSTTKTTHLLTEVDEAFFNNQAPLPPIVDLNNAYCRYEIRLNRAEYKYVVENSLYSLDGQEAFTGAGGKVSFPEGDSSTETYGALELKVAWKKMGKGDDPAKFHIIEPTVYHPNSTPKFTKGDAYGLVGMHIMVRTVDAPQWVWATFEHVGNAPFMNLIPNEKGSSKPLRVSAGQGVAYSFWDEAGKASFGGFDTASYEAMLKVEQANLAAAKIAAPQKFPNNPAMQANYIAKAAADYSQPEADRIPSQITRVITTNNEVSVSKWTQALNAKMRGQLDGIVKNNVWSNYRLISTQWPVDPDSGGAGNPAPVSLANPVMETYMQVNGSCMGCHLGSTFGSPDALQDANFSFLLQRAK